MKLTMRTTLSLLLIAGSLALHSTDAMAWVSSSPSEKQYSFKFHMQKESFEYSQIAGTYEEAYEKAAQACYRHFKGGRRLSEDRGLDIIDICANPRSI